MNRKLPYQPTKNEARHNPFRVIIARIDDIKGKPYTNKT